MNIKQRVFADIAAQIPFRTNKMVSNNQLAIKYANELKQDKNEVAKTAALCEQEFGHKFDVDNVNDLIIINMTLNNRAFDEVSKARNELIAEGYLRKWSKQVRFGQKNYYGLTEKGWKYAKRYIEMAKEETK